MTVIAHDVARALGLSLSSVERTLALMDEGATIPFIARYRKEQTGNLDEVQIGLIAERSAYLKDLGDRRQTILKAIAEQGKLTEELKAALEGAATKQALEDLYLPYKPKRRTRAQMAREKGYEPLALAILAQEQALVPGLEVNDEALAGARDIIAEMLSERSDLRALVRERMWGEGTLRGKLVKGKESEGKNFSDYFDFREPVKSAPSHRVLALRRGEAEGFLKVSIELPSDPLVAEIRRRVDRRPQAPLASHLRQAIEDAYERLLGPSGETAVLEQLRERADEQAIAVFAANLRSLLLSPPLGDQPLVALDPGLRTGCKLVALSAQGEILAHDVIFPLEPRRDEASASVVLAKYVREHAARAVAIGNGTGGREAESFVRRLVTEGVLPKTLIVASVNEAGASVYSASEIAREEFPNHDVTVRGAVSIGRRLQDPLAELVKIDPKSIGVGQYQHDVDKRALERSLDGVVESCVNHVGVDLNTASGKLLSYVAGIGPVLAQNIVSWRAEQGGFSTRAELKKVPRLGPKAFEQAAGFLRVRGPKAHPLDSSAVHPERYELVERIAKEQRSDVRALIGNREQIGRIPWSRYQSEEVGEPTLRDIASELEKPGRDPRASFVPVGFRSDVTGIEHLEEGMLLEGVVTNVAAFGAFVDIGVHQDGLVHVSELAHRFIRDPLEVVKVGDRVKVKVIKVERDRKRIGLSIKQTSAPPRRDPPGQARPAEKKPFNAIKLKR